MNRHAELNDLLNQGPLRRASHPELIGTINQAVRNGTITPVFPGIYLPADRADDTGMRLRAAQLWEPRLIVTGRLAAQHQFWPELSVGDIEIAVPRQRNARPSGFAIMHRPIPARWVGQWQGIRMTRPALTAVDLCAELGDEVINRALLSRKATVEQLHQALQSCPNRRDNVERRTRLLDARGNPWAYSERLCHNLLWSAGITRWQGNPKLIVRGNVYYPDVLFDDCPAVIEVDGLHHVRNPTTYQNDLHRQNDFMTEGYAMLRYTVSDLEHRPGMFLDDVHDLLRHLRKR